MKTFIHAAFVLAICFGKENIAQTIYIGTDLAVKGSGTLYVSGNFTTNSSASYINDGTVIIKGNINNDNAAMVQGTGTTMLTGSLSQSISGTQPFVVNNITFNNTSSGSSNIIANKQLIIGSSASFTDGIIEAATEPVTFNSGATYSGASNNSHVNGLIEKIGNQAFTFPVGDALALRPTTISAPPLSSDAFTSQYIKSDPFNTYTSATLAPSLDHISSCEYWLINQTSGSSNIFLSFGYDNVYSCGITDTSALQIAYLDNNVWENIGHGIITGNTTTGTLQSSASSNKFGAFTLASSSPSNPLPVSLLGFKATYEAAKRRVILKWETASEINSDYFTIERSIDGKEWTKISKLKAAGNSISKLQYKAFDTSPVIGTSYYRLKETDYNGDYFYSSIDFVTTHPEASDFSIFPNPFSSGTSISHWENEETMYHIEVINTIGNVLISKDILFANGENKIYLDMEQFASGNYFLKIHSMDFSVVQTRKLIKLK